MTGIEIIPVDDALMMKDAVAQVADLFPALPKFVEILICGRSMRKRPTGKIVAYASLAMT